MNDLLYDRRLACLITVVLITAGLLISSRRGLISMRNATEDYFFQGENGYSINNDLEDRAAAAYNMTTVAERYLTADDDYIKAVLVAKDALLAETDISGKYKRNLEMTAAVESLSVKLGQLELSEKDEGYRYNIMDILKSKDLTISHDPYNSMAEEYNKQIRRFPANILSRLVFAGSVELYGK